MQSRTDADRAIRAGTRMTHVAAAGRSMRRWVRSVGDVRIQHKEPSSFACSDLLACKQKVKSVLDWTS